MKKILITGATGFSASHLISLLSSEPGPIEVHLTSRAGSSAGNVTLCDLGDKEAVLNLIKMVRPTQIYHLAGSFSNDYEVDYRANVLGTKHILDAVHTLSLECRVLLIGSAAEYGVIAERDNPVSETQPLRPISIYGLTKLYQSHLMDYFWRAHELDVVMARPFNLLGKGMSSRLFVGRLYEQIELYQQGKIKSITVGNLDSRRDYIRGEEAVKAYRLVMDYGFPGEVYNVGSGVPIKIGDLLSNLLSEHGLDMQIVSSSGVTAHRAGKFDVAEIYADIRKLSALRGATA